MALQPLYDQRNCGRSKAQSNAVVLHIDNVKDLQSIIVSMTEEYGISPAVIIGHSYGAKVVYDYIQMSGTKFPSVFLSTANSVLIPRINNLLLDLCYLKSVDKEQYQKLLKEFNSIRDENIWNITEQLSSVFHENKNRPNFYWANLDCKERVEALQKELSTPLNAEVFASVRRDLYSKEENYSVNISSLENHKYLWVNGFHDFIMNGQASLSDPTLKTTIFYKSAHYPHIEEHQRFCEEMNAFINK